MKNKNTINKRIAIACGWTWDDDNLFWISPDKSFVAVDPLNYLQDLNAMNEAEKALRNQFTTLEEAYWRNLAYVQPHPIFATAVQRAEAFLRTIGQWEEGNNALEVISA